MRLVCVGLVCIGLGIDFAWWTVDLNGNECNVSKLGMVCFGIVSMEGVVV